MTILKEIEEAHEDYMTALAEAARVYKKGGFCDHYDLAMDDLEICLKRYNELRKAPDDLRG